jgi:hypothetical protein
VTSGKWRSVETTRPPDVGAVVGVRLGGMGVGVLVGLGVEVGGMGVPLGGTGLAVSVGGGRVGVGGTEVLVGGSGLGVTVSSPRMPMVRLQARLASTSKPPSSNGMFRFGCMDFLL